ncbi:MAG: transposase [Chitinophagales bacterium]|nr:transposase [Chitinophagales bacterium]
MYSNLLFEQTFSIQQHAFFHTDLGKLRQALPLKQLAEQIAPPRSELSGRGRKPWLTVEGALALEVLKHHLRLSDQALIERLNTDWAMQMFCGIQLRQKRISDLDLPSRWRSYIGKHLDIDKSQLACVKAWKQYMENTHAALTDATVYESYITYPADAKLIWNGCAHVYQMLCTVRKALKLRRTRSNHNRQQQQYYNLVKRKKKSRRLSRKTCRSLLKYLDRLMGNLSKLLDIQNQVTLSKRQHRRLQVIEKMKRQQWLLHFGKQSHVPHRIVSLHKPYVRPILRGKEVKPVEFGCKVNKLQVDGISFIEHYSYEAFNEGTRLISTIHLQRRYFGKCSAIGADAIYATNKNRTYCTDKKIATCFIPKGKQGPVQEQKSQMRSLLAKARSTQLEGSFGNEKNHYLLDKIKARTQDTEIAWIFFGMLTANAAVITHRIGRQQKSIRAA